MAYQNMKNALGFVPQSGGDRWYVSPAGNDSNTGNSPTDPKLTIGAALTAAASGDIIVIRAGTYTEVGLDLGTEGAKTGIELHFEIGAVLDPASGTALTVSGDSSKIVCPDGSLKITPAAQATGVAVTGAFCYLSDIRVTCFITEEDDSADIGFDVTGAGCVLNNCRVSSPDVAAFKIQAHKTKMDDCCTGGGESTGPYASIGFWITNSCDKFRAKDCSSQGHGTNGWLVDAGCTNGSIKDCASGGGDGPKLNNGTDFTWPGFRFDHIAEKDITLTADGTTVSYNLFKITGHVKINNIYGEVTTNLAGENTNSFLDVYSTNGSDTLSKNTTCNLGALIIGSSISRLDKKDKILIVKSAAGPFINDSVDVKEEGFRVGEDRTGGAHVATYVRFTSTSASASSGVVHWHAEWGPVSDDGFLEAA